MDGIIRLVDDFFRRDFRDITDRREAEKALQENEEQFRTLVGNIAGVVYRCIPRRPWTMQYVSEEISKVIDRFATATIQGVDREDLGRYPAKQHKVMAFHYGAIEYLCRQYALNEQQTLGMFVTFINKYFNMPVTESGSISERLQGFRNDAGERGYLEAGADVFRRWHEENDRRAPLQLGEMLKNA